MKIAAMFTLLAGFGFAEEPRRPACTAQNRGSFWPAEANTSHEALLRLYRSGQLRLCTRATWRYQWEPLSVNFQAMKTAHTSAPKPPEPQEETVDDRH
jgi:hypothetical protein